MYYPIDEVNRITLNTIKEQISPESRQPVYLSMLFPPELKDFDSTHLLDFIYDTEDITLRNTRTTFANGNVTRQHDKQTYSRANQNKLALIANYLRQEGAAAGWIRHLAAQFPLLDHGVLARMLPADADRYPEAFSALLTRTVRDGETAHLFLLMLLWAVFGERITMAESIFPKEAAAAALPVSAEAEPPGRKEFCDAAFRTVPEIQSVDFAFHKGDFWLLDSTRIEFLHSLIDKKIHLHVLVDLVEPSRLISSHMEHSKRFVLPHEMVLQYWREFQSRNPEYVHVRFSPVPVLRNYCCFESADPQQSVMRLTFYSYGHKNFKEYYVVCPPVDSKPYRIFHEEFQYLWNLGVDAASPAEKGTGAR